MIYVIVVVAIIPYHIVLFYAVHIRTSKNHQLLNQVQYKALNYNQSYCPLSIHNQSKPLQLAQTTRLVSGCNDILNTLYNSYIILYNTLD